MSVVIDAPDLKDHLLNAILPFWERHSLDRDYGGFITHLSQNGAIVDPSGKFLTMQARMIYSFTAGATIGGPLSYLLLAEQGLSFLTNFRDLEQDGWYWTTSRTGEPRQQQKRTYGHAFVVYALAEYARVTHNSAALASAHHGWSIISQRLWDHDNEGVIEACERDWTPSDPNHTMGTHLHTLEALISLDEALGGDRLQSHINAFADLILEHMVHSEQLCARERFLPNWTPIDDEEGNLANYGHNLEAAWLLLRLYRKSSDSRYRETARNFLDYALRHGLDDVNGGMFSHGPFGQPATRREKIWWVQTEAIVAFLLGYLVFRENRYWEAFTNIANFCLHHLHDSEHGEWFPVVDERGHPLDTNKGSAWKAAYHITQACVCGHEYLAEIASAG